MRFDQHFSMDLDFFCDRFRNGGLSHTGSSSWRGTSWAMESKQKRESTVRAVTTHPKMTLHCTEATSSEQGAVVWERPL
ncbi:hypothetical protein JOE46_000457 [Rhodococcus sp. PvR099]|nr:hypothetical protein [Rhodococcus sp. PvR099]